MKKFDRVADYYYSHMNERRALLIAGGLIVIIALLDWKVLGDVSLGILYLVPIILVAGFLDRWQVLGVCFLCVVLREVFGPFQFDKFDTATRMATGLLTFLGAGLFVRELSQRQRAAVALMNRIAEEVRLRQEAENQLRVLIETSPAAILTADADGNILLANEASHHLFGFDQQPLAGEAVGKYLPILSNVRELDWSSHPFRSMLEDRGRRLNGELFLAHIWFSTYSTPEGPRLAAIILDASEDLREREEKEMRWIQTSSRILVGAVTHEVRNMCWAIAVVHANLRRFPGIEESEDFKALGMLVDGLERIAATELRLTSEALSGTDLQVLVDELRIVIEPRFRDAGARLILEIPESFPLLRADPHGLLQVFLNLAQNSLRAMQKSDVKQLTLSAALENERAVIRFRDTGPGVAAPERLFKPFQAGSEGTGMGLYISRAMVHAFAGELRWESQPSGCCFAVELPLAQAEEHLHERASTV